MLLLLEGRLLHHILQRIIRVRASIRAQILMSLSCSAGHKVLQSPFSHAELYGVEHPLCGGASSTISTSTRSSASAPGPGPGRRKHRASKQRKKSTSASTGTGCSDPMAKTKAKSRKRKGIKVTSAPSVLPAKNQAHKVLSPSSAVSLAQVDAASPNVRRSQHKAAKGSRLEYHSARSTLTTKPAAQDPSTIRSHHRYTQSSATVAAPATLSAVIANKAKGPSTTTTTTPFSSIPSLLTFSTMSTSEVVLRMKQMQQRRNASGLTTPTIISMDTRCLKNKPVSVTLPPHMRVHRQAFHAASTRFGQRMRGEAGPLSVEEIGRNLGRLQYRNIIVMSGAGVSTSSGIPDFRTPGTGLYDNLEQYKIPDPTAIFDITYFSRHPKAFYALARELYPGRYQPNPAHYFVRLLQEKKLLLRNYTQNIDGLERIAGVHAGKLVEAHGSFATASCIQCHTKQSPAEVKAAIFSEKVPRCKHKHCFGLVKPDVVFFGEDLPARFYSLQLPDFSKCDLLIVMGTSLEVEPFASLVTLPAASVPRLLLNRELVGPFKHRSGYRLTDVSMTGDLVESVMELAQGAGWERELKVLWEGEEVDETAGGEAGGEESPPPPSPISPQDDVSLKTPAKQQPLPPPHTAADLADVVDLDVAFAGLSLDKRDCNQSKEKTSK